MEHIQELLNEIKTTNDQEFLARHAQSANPGVASEVARNTNTSPKVLSFLSRHSSVIVRHEVAKNQASPLELLEMMSKDKDMLVRDYAARMLWKKRYGDKL